MASTVPFSRFLYEKSDLSVGKIEDPAVGDRDPVRVAADVVDDAVGVVERRFHVDDPCPWTTGRFSAVGNRSSLHIWPCFRGMRVRLCRTPFAGGT